MIPLLILLAIAAGWFFIYRRDPWRWKRFGGLLRNFNNPAYQGLEPLEAVPVSQPIDLPVATENPLSPDTQTTLTNYAKRFDSFALIVLHQGKICLEWYADGWNRQRPTQSQSMHKSLLPILLYAAVEDGAIPSLDEPLNTYLPEWANDERGAITLRQMLLMSSGLSQFGFSLNPLSDDFGWLFGGDTLPIVLSATLAWEPGSQFDYNNLNSYLLGLVLERATGQRYAHYLGEKLWQPLGGHPADVWLDNYNGRAHTECCLLASAMDWAKFGQMTLNGGNMHSRQIISAKNLQGMLTQSPHNPHYGLHIWLGYEQEPNPRAGAGGYTQTEPFLDDTTFFAAGYGGQRVYVAPAHELVVVRLGPGSGPKPLKDGWDNTFLVNHIIRQLGDN